MTVYAVNEIEVSDAEVYARYQEINTALVLRLGGRYVVRGGSVTPCEGPSPHRVVIIAFDTMETMQAWKNDPDYARAKVFRDRSSRHRSYYVAGHADDWSL